MTVKKTIGAYMDCLRVLNAANRHGGLRLDFTDQGGHGAAIKFRQRCYKLRSILYQNAELRTKGLPGEIAATPYDTLFLRVDEGSPILQILHREVTAKVLDLEGNPVDLFSEDEVAAAEGDLMPEIDPKLLLELDE